MRPPVLRLLSLLLLALGVVLPAGAQSPAAPADSAPRRAVVYALSAGDRVRVAVFQEEDLSAFTRVDAKGEINLPLIGTVRVGGLNIAAAQQAVEESFRTGRILRDPKVTITVEEYARREIQVMGEVRNPGKFDLPVEDTISLTEAIGRAGGFTDIAKGTEVRVSRIGADGKESSIIVDVESMIRRGKGKADDMLLQPGDIVYVPQRLI